MAHAPKLVTEAVRTRPEPSYKLTTVLGSAVPDRVRRVSSVWPGFESSSLLSSTLVIEGVARVEAVFDWVFIVVTLPMRKKLHTADEL